MSEVEVAATMDPSAPGHIYYVLGRLEGKIDGLMSAMNSHLTDDATVHAREEAGRSKLEVRLNSLERGRSWVMGMAVTVSGIVTMAGAVIGWWFHGKV